MKSIIKKQNWRSWVAVFLVVVILGVLWIPLSKVETDPAVLRIWIEQLGPFAPIAFVLLNIIQIVVAPIPGYPVQVLGGILFGFVMGSVYTVGGMVAGGVLSAWLVRRLGRPWLEKQVGGGELESWEQITHVNSFWTWWLILLVGPGDLPYLFAGLSHIRLTTLALAILTSRGPFTVLIVWLGDGVIDFPLTWLALLMAVVVLIIIIGFSQRHRIEKWSRGYLTDYVNKRNEENA